MFLLLGNHFRIFIRSARGEATSSGTHTCQQKGALLHETLPCAVSQSLCCVRACVRVCVQKKTRGVWRQNEFAMEKNCLLSRYSLEKRESRGRWVDVNPERKRKSRTMSREESHGVVLTGYHSNAESLAKAGPRAPARPSVVDPETTALRWDKECVVVVCGGMTAMVSCPPGQCVCVSVSCAAGHCLVTFPDSLVSLCPYWRRTPPSTSGDVFALLQAPNQQILSVTFTLFKRTGVSASWTRR